MFFLRLFKNRGDIYIPSVKVKSDMEQKILLVLLAFTVAFTGVFFLIVGIKYDFSVKKFFAPDNLVESEKTQEDILPNVSGKTNFLFTVTNPDTQELYFCSLIQTDMDSLGYKVCTLDAKTQVQGKNFSQIYKEGGAGNVMNAAKTLFGIKIDYYIDETLNDYGNMFDEMGSINYVVLSDIRYKDTSVYGFNIKLKEGSQTVDGSLVSKLIRYYLEIKNYNVANEIILTSLSQQINSENYEKREKLFSALIKNSKTNITINDYNNSEDDLKVLSSETSGIEVYSVAPEYENASVSEKSKKQIKNYFEK